MPRKAGPRLPFAPVVEYAKVDTDRELADLLPFSLKWVQQHRSLDIALTIDQAEACAEALGLHPLLLWGDAYHVACSWGDEG